MSPAYAFMLSHHCDARSDRRRRQRKHSEEVRALGGSGTRGRWYDTPQVVAGTMMWFSVFQSIFSIISIILYHIYIYISCRGFHCLRADCLTASILLDSEGFQRSICMFQRTTWVVQDGGSGDSSGWAIASSA